MINLACKIPNKVTVAVSGGPDSMALLDFTCRGNREVSALYAHHGTAFGDESQSLVSHFCNQRGIPLTIADVSTSETSNQECVWGQARNALFQSNATPVVTAHTLDDAVEWWIMTSMRGHPRLMPIENGNVFRPFLFAPKSELISWCGRHKIPFLVDPTNLDGVSNDRARLRKLMPQLEQIYPGLRTTIRNLYAERKWY